MTFHFKNLLVLLLCVSFSTCKSSKDTSKGETTDPQKNISSTSLKTGAERLDAYLPMLKGKRVGLIINQTSVVGETHLIDFLIQNGVNVKKIFSPEHGIRGNDEAGAKIKDGKDDKTGLPIISLHGNKYKPTELDLDDLDVLIFDIQDVGVRFYTYISTLFNAMEACAEADKTMLVFDRPNPNGNYIDGPVLDMKFKSFVGIAPIPVVHGLTVGEFAQMANGEGWLAKQSKCKLEVIRCDNYTHDTYYEIKIAPSPNLKTMRSILLYPSICFFEGTNVSLGRGTDMPFEVIGHPALKGKYTFSFIPKPNAAASNPPQKDKVCFGIAFNNLSEREIFDRKKLDFSYLFEFYKPVSTKEEYFLKNNFFDKLAGTDTFRKAILEGKNEDEVRKMWQPDLEKYTKMRKKYLLYP
jgi:uncharacterized protein YbbC (DUF1343 family)